MYTYIPSFFLKLINLFIYFWLCWVFVSVRGLSLVAASGGQSSSRCTGLSPSRPLLLRSTSSRRTGSAVWLTGLVAPGHVGSSQTRARTRVPCIGRQTLNHCATREALSPLFQTSFPFRSPQSTEQSSLCYTIGSHQLSILYIVVYICQSQSPNSSYPPFPPWYP